MGERKLIGLKDVRSLPINSEMWDSDVTGFGARRQRSDAVAYVVVYRTAEGRSRRFTIGRHGAPWTPDTARKEARRILGKVAGGEDPAADKRAKRVASTIAELCDEYLAEVESGRLMTRSKRPKAISTILSDKSRIEGHIKPLLGRLPVAAVTPEDIERFMHSVAAGETVKRSKTQKQRGLSIVRGGMGTASKAVGLLGAIFTYAQRRRIRSDNPAHAVMRPLDGKRERRLTEAEYGRLGAALELARDAGIWPPAIEATRFLALTGWRSGEALGLRREEVDLTRRVAVLPTTKTGRSARYLSRDACDLIQATNRTEGLIFPPSRGVTTMTGFRKFWNRIAKLGQVPADITPHVLRHSFASLAADLGYSEPTIATLLGHKGYSVTSRYLHAADPVMLAAADAVAAETAKRMICRRSQAGTEQVGGDSIESAKTASGDP